MRKNRIGGRRWPPLPSGEGWYGPPLWRSSAPPRDILPIGTDRGAVANPLAANNLRRRRFTGRTPPLSREMT